MSLESIFALYDVISSNEALYHEHTCLVERSIQSDLALAYNMSLKFLIDK